MESRKEREEKKEKKGNILQNEKKNGI